MSLFFVDLSPRVIIRAKKRYAGLMWTNTEKFDYMDTKVSYCGSRFGYVDHNIYFLPFFESQTFFLLLFYFILPYSFSKPLRRKRVLKLFAVTIVPW